VPGQVCGADLAGGLAGALTEQARRCGRPGCRCADGEPHGPHAYFTPRPAGRGRARCVPTALAGVVRRCLRRGEQAEAVLAEISAINAERRARRDCGSRRAPPSFVTAFTISSLCAR